MDVLHLTHQFLPETRGGVEAYVSDIVGAQRARGIDAHVLTGSHEPWPQPGCEELVVDGVPVHRLHRDDLYFDLYSKAWHPGIGRLLEDLLAAHRPRVVHVHQWIRLTSDLVESVQRHGIAAVVTLHDFYASCPRAFRLRRDGAVCTAPVTPAVCADCVPRYGHETPRELADGIELFADQSRAELRMADAVLAGVPATADLVARTLGLPRERFTVLPLGYRRRFAGEPPLPGPAAGGPIRFAFWGGVAPHKGVRALVDAAGVLRARVGAAAFEVHVLGAFATPALGDELRAAAAGSPVVFHGRFETPALRRLGLHVGVFPSTCLETFGIVLDECFELGLPAIVSDRGALPGRAAGGGLVVAAGSAEALAAAMERFCREPGLWAALRAGLPELPPDLGAHCGALDAVYAAAVARRAGLGPQRDRGIPLARRAALLVRQRESAQARLPFGELR